MASLRLWAAHPPRLGAEGFRFGEPTGTAIDDHEWQWRGRCCHKRRLEYRLMVRRRDP